MKVKLVTFSDGSLGLRAAGKRLVKQADATGWFTNQSIGHSKLFIPKCLDFLWNIRS